MKFLFLGYVLFNSLNVNAVCVEPNEYYPFDSKWAPKNDNGEYVLGMYSRISPDGKYVLRSFSGKGLSEVTLMELIKVDNGNNIVTPYNTPLKNEAFPVMGTWRYLVDIDGDHYRLSDIKKNQKNAKKQFTGGIRGFYTVAAELPGGNLNVHQIRSLSWPNSNPDNVGVGQLSNQVIKIKKDGDSFNKTDSSSVYYMCSNLKSSDGQIMSLPMLSPNGMEFASMPQNPKDNRPSMRIYSIGSDNKSCEKVDDLRLIVAKIIFSFPEDNKFALFYSSGSVTNKGNGVSFFDRTSKNIFSLSDPMKRVFADSYPGFTKDGRIVYGAKWEECSDSGCIDKAGYVVSDPYQAPDMIDFKKNSPEMAKHLRECITKEEVSQLIEIQSKEYL
jgi:hypothetical protein